MHIFNMIICSIYLYIIILSMGLDQIILNHYINFRYLRQL